MPYQELSECGRGGESWGCNLHRYPTSNHGPGAENTGSRVSRAGRAARTHAWRTGIPAPLRNASCCPFRELPKPSARPHEGRAGRVESEKGLKAAYLLVNALRSEEVAERRDNLSRCSGDGQVLAIEGEMMEFAGGSACIHVLHARWSRGPQSLPWNRCHRRCHASVVSSIDDKAFDAEALSNRLCLRVIAAGPSAHLCVSPPASESVQEPRGRSTVPWTLGRIETQSPSSPPARHIARVPSGSTVLLLLFSLVVLLFEPTLCPPTSDTIRPGSNPAPCSSPTLSCQQRRVQSTGPCRPDPETAEGRRRLSDIPLPGLLEQATAGTGIAFAVRSK